MSEKKNPMPAPTQVGPWRRTSRRQVYDNPWITLTHDDVITPGGTEGIYGKVHFKNRALGIIPLDQGNRTVLVGQHRYPLNEFSWEIPMGGGRLDEDPLLSAKRELQEETGLLAGNWTQLFKLHTSNSVTDEEGYVYLARDLSPGEQALEETESDLVIKELPLGDAVRMIATGEITDLISISGLLMVEKMLREG
jgi:8-oxo-dGTP pyrophosphatase MutT (NUDIX family)